MSRLDEIKARCDAATEGPWVRDMHSPDMSGRSGWYIRGPRKLGLRSMVLNSRMLSGDAEFVEAAREDVPWLVDQVERLERWKFEACEVMSGLRELGKALGLGLGVQITGPAALAEVTRLTAERDALAAQVARVESLAEWFDSVPEEHLSQDDCQCEMKDCYECGPWHACTHDGPPARARQLRAALAGSEADTGAEDAGHRCEPYYSRSECGQCGWQEQWCATCSRQMCGCATEATALDAMGALDRMLVASDAIIEAGKAVDQ